MTKTTKKTEETPHKIQGVQALFGNSKALKVIPLDNITSRKDQPRRYFDDKTLDDLAESIKKHGVLEPVILRATDNNSYELIAGERRYRAAILAGEDTIPARILRIGDEEVAEVALIENLQREDLNPLEETEAVLDLLTLRLKCERNYITQLLNLASRNDETAKEATDNPDWNVIIEVLKVVGVSHHGFRTNRLPLLKLPSDVKEALISGNIAYTKAKEIAKIKDGALRQRFLKEALEKNLSLTDIKSRTKGLKESSKQSEQQAKEIVSLKSTVQKSYKKIAKIPQLSEDPKLQVQAEQLFTAFIVGLDQLIEQSKESAEEFYK